MAKSSKSSKPASSTSVKPESATRASKGKEKTAKIDPKPPATSAAPTPVRVNTDQTAQSAAAALAAGVKRDSIHTKPESAGFKKLKAGAGKLAISSTSSLLSTLNSNKPHQGGFAYQIGHNQTPGKGHSRSGVPRRTSG